MIEPELAFADLSDNMDVIEDMIKYCIRYVLEHAPEEMAFFQKMIDKDCIDRVKKVADSEFRRMTYTEAIKELEKSKTASTTRTFTGAWIFSPSTNATFANRL